MISKIKNISLAYFVILFLFVILLTLSSSIPLDTKSYIFGKTVQTFLSEGTYPSYGLPWRKIVLDNYTEAVMINTAYFTDYRKPIESILTNKRYASTQNSTDQVAALKNLSENIPGKEYGYERYWHGYLVYLRPLSSVFPYQVIRVFVSIFIYGLFVFFIYGLFRKFGFRAAVIVSLGFLIVDFFYIGASMQFSNVFIVALTTAIYHLSKKSPSRASDYLTFFVSGALTSFFDLLTAPLVTLGILLIINNLKPHNSIKDIFINSLYWSIGYLGLWSSKWFLSTIYFTPQAFFVALNQIANRTVSKADDKFNQFEAVRLNVFQLIGYSRESKIILLLLFFALGTIILRYRKNKNINIRIIFSWFLIGLIPYIWYLVAANHSYLHVWFTYRIQLVSVISILFIYVELLDQKLILKDLVRIYRSLIRLFPTSKNRCN